MADYTIQEILSQPAVWRRTLEIMRGDASPLKKVNSLIGDGPVLFTGCGSSYYLALACAGIWGRFAGGPAFALPSADIWMYPECHFVKGNPGTVFAMTRSGKTPEVCQAARHLRQSYGWRAIAVTCYPGTPIFNECDATVLLDEAYEISRFTTRALTAKILTAAILAAQRSGNKEFDRELCALPDLAQGLIDRYRAAIEMYANQGNFDQYVFLGHGPYFGLASELMLKVKEIARTPAEVYHSLEYLHGPRYGATPTTLITVLLSGGGLQHQLELLPKLKDTGAQIAVVCERSTPEIAASANVVLELNSGLSDYGRMLLMMPLVQLFAYYRALALGRAAWIEEMVRFPEHMPKS